jgi:hypothetical protein
MTPTKLTTCFVLGSALALASLTALAQEKPPLEINKVLMESTFKIEGPAASGTTLGTAFILGRPIPSQAPKARFVMVTAAHVLENIQGENAVLDLRRSPAPSQWERLPFPIKIRTGQSPLWAKHPNADVAVMYVALPHSVSIPLLPTDLLADDKMLSEFEIHPGDELNCLGYPLGLESNSAGFPILRSGKIASYPLLPTKQTLSFLFDFRVFEGNSGGPVYFAQSNRTYGGTTQLGQTIQFLVGLVTRESIQPQVIQLPYLTELRQLQLELAQVVHASFIKEAVNLLPSPEQVPK